MPKIHKQRKKLQREMAKQKRMLESLAADLSKEVEKERASGISEKNWHSLGEPHSFPHDECPADNLECPSALGVGITPVLPPAHPTQAGDGILGSVVQGGDVRVSMGRV